MSDSDGVEQLRSDLIVRNRCHYFAVPEDQDLWRFVPHSGPFRKVPRDVAPPLYWDQIKRRIRLRLAKSHHLPVGEMAHGTGEAVLKEDGKFARQQRVALVCAGNLRYVHAFFQ